MSGPRVVALGGGHGLSASLQAVRRYAGAITAIVSVADDGGSSGRLRDAFGIPAPGDLRKCLVALSDGDSVWARAFEHRFDAGELQGHALGNLVLTGLAGVTGDFAAALDEAARLLGACGRVLPATTVPVVIKAEADGGVVEGQVAVERAVRISAVSLVPADAAPPDEAVRALADADQVVIGPGSHFTSVVAAALPTATRAALESTRARKVYVCNLRTNAETAGFDVAAHVDALVAHGVPVDVVLHDPRSLPLGDVAAPVVAAELFDDEQAGHDPVRLAAALSDLVG